MCVWWQFCVSGSWVCLCCCGFIWAFLLQWEKSPMSVKGSGLIFSPSHGCQSPCPGLQMLPSLQAKPGVFTSVFCVFVYLCMIFISTHYLHMSECLFEPWVSRALGILLSDLHGWVTGETQRPTAVSCKRRLNWLFEQDMGELESLLWNPTAFCLWQTCLPSFAWP